VKRNVPDAVRPGAIFGASLLLLVGIGAIFAGRWSHSSASTAMLHPPPSWCGAVCALIVEPDDGVAPVLAMIAHAQRSIALVEYELEDPAVIAALARAVDRGIAAKVILDSASSHNQSAFDALTAAGVPVRWASSAFPYTHEKALLTDGTHLLVMTFNLVPNYYPTGRDFGITDDDPADVAAMETVFDADWRGAVAPPVSDPGNDLVWSPGSRTVLIDLIAGASRSLDVYNEEMADPAIRAALARAAGRGVAVRVIMTYSAEWHDAFVALADAGVHVRTFPAGAQEPYIHAKAIVADGDRAFVGSENFSATSLDRNRELGLRVDGPAVITGLVRTFARDWNAGEPFRS
jgi:phosphatidylserine/phosphatidylglycerophosphate/cardiolipin synthase-like enzyme